MQTYYAATAEAQRAKSRDYFAVNKRTQVPKNVERVRRRKLADPAYAARLNAQSGAAARAIRRAALTHYGGDPPACACCGEAHDEFLQLDHVNGGGGAQRQQQGSKGSTGTFYWLRRNGYPEGYRVLCANCNHALGRYGYCPHQT